MKNIFTVLLTALLVVGCTSITVSPPQPTHTAPDLDQMVREMILPTPRLLSVKEVTEDMDPAAIFSGTGVTVVSRPFEDRYETFVITNAHVVAALITDEARKVVIEAQAKVAAGEDFIVDMDVKKSFRTMWLTYLQPDGWNAPDEIVEGQVVMFDQYADISLLRFESDHAFPTVNIPQSDPEYKLFSHVYSIGGAVGNLPFPTDGIVSRLVRYDSKGTTIDKLLLSSPVADGASGGPTYQYSHGCSCYEWVAVNQAVAALPKQLQGTPFTNAGILVPIYHMHWAIPLHEVRFALADTPFATLLDK
jgi:S1-C subfamily serine protease